MKEDILTLEGSVPTLKEVLRSIILNVPGSTLLLLVAMITLAYIIWSSLKAGYHYSKGGLTMQQSYLKGFYKSAFPNSPTCVSRTLYVCALVLAFLVCALRGIVGMIYISI